MKDLLCIAFTAVLLTIGAGNVQGCSCPGSGEPLSNDMKWWLSKASVVFSGEVVKLERVRGTPYMIATLEVEEYWKGEPGTTVDVRTEILPGMSCGFAFNIGVSYIVYAAPRSGSLLTDSCSGNRQRWAPDGKAQIEVLGPGKIPKLPPRN